MFMFRSILFAVLLITCNLSAEEIELTSLRTSLDAALADRQSKELDPILESIQSPEQQQCALQAAADHTREDVSLDLLKKGFQPCVETVKQYAQLAFESADETVKAQWLLIYEYAQGSRELDRFRAYSKWRQIVSVLFEALIQ